MASAFAARRHQWSHAQATGIERGGISDGQRAIALLPDCRSGCRVNVAMNDDAVAAGLVELGQLDRPALGERWSALFGTPPPRHSKSTLLYLALTWNLQLQAHPHWSKASSLSRRKRLLNAVATPTLATGSRLVREWQGTTHQVTVLEQGFAYAGQTYRSLSAVARTITGTNWSGPLFFGMRK